MQIKVLFELNLQMVYIEMVGLHMFYAMWSTHLDFGARLRASISSFLSCTLTKVDQLAGSPSYITAYNSSFFASASRFFYFRGSSRFAGFSHRWEIMEVYWQGMEMAGRSKKN
jgi:hypothetical protein